jgi:hypothetical protein
VMLRGFGCGGAQPTMVAASRGPHPAARSLAKKALRIRRGLPPLPRPLRNSDTPGDELTKLPKGWFGPLPAVEGTMRCTRGTGAAAGAPVLPAGLAPLRRRHHTDTSSTNTRERRRPCWSIHLRRRPATASSAGENGENPGAGTDERVLPWAETDAGLRARPFRLLPQANVGIWS